jgi:hypothetical protein
MHTDTHTDMQNHPHVMGEIQPRESKSWSTVSVSTPKVPGSLSRKVKITKYSLNYWRVPFNTVAIYDRYFVSSKTCLSRFGRCHKSSLATVSEDSLVGFSSATCGGGSSAAAPPFSKPCPPAPSRPHKCDLPIYDLYVDFPCREDEDLDSLATAFDFDAAGIATTAAAAAVDDTTYISTTTPTSFPSFPPDDHDDIIVCDQSSDSAPSSSTPTTPSPTPPPARRPQ